MGKILMIMSVMFFLVSCNDDIGVKKNDKLIEKDNEIVDLMDHVEELESINESYLTEIEVLEKDNDELKLNLDSALNELKKCKDDVLSKEEEIGILSDDYEQLLSDYNSLLNASNQLIIDNEIEVSYLDSLLFDRVLRSVFDEKYRDDILMISLDRLNERFFRLLLDFEKDGEYRSEAVYVRLDMDPNISDGNDLKTITLQYGDSNTVIDINSESYFSRIGIMDCDKNDGKLELIISVGDIEQVNYIYQIINGKLTLVQTIHNRIVGHDGNGKIFYWGGNVYEGYFKEELVMSYYTLNSSEVNNDPDFIGREIVSDKKMVVFMTSDDVVRYMYYESIETIDQNTIKGIIDVGDTFRVIDVENNNIIVELENGTVGYLQYNHWVWN